MEPETVTERVYVVSTRLAYGREMTTQEVATLLNMSRTGAYALMARISRVGPVRLEDGKWKQEQPSKHATEERAGQ